MVPVIKLGHATTRTTTMAPNSSHLDVIVLGLVKLLQNVHPVGDDEVGVLLLLGRRDQGLGCHQLLHVVIRSVQKQNFSSQPV